MAEVLGYKSTIPLADDVLILIFSQLTDQDLLHCEAVCHQWRNVLMSGTLWKRSFHRMIASSVKWKTLLRNFQICEQNLQTVHYRSLYRATRQEVKKIDRNWRTGNFKLIEESVRRPEAVNSDYMAYTRYSQEDNKHFIEIVSRKNSKGEPIGRIEVSSESKCVLGDNGTVVVWDKKKVEIFNTDGLLLSEVPELTPEEKQQHDEVQIKKCATEGHVLAVCRSKRYSTERLSVWNIKDPLNVNLLMRNSTDQRARYSDLEVDEHFIAHWTWFRDGCFNFISRKTLELKTKIVKFVHRKHFFYDRGMFILHEHKILYDIIQIWDVASSCEQRSYIETSSAFCDGCPLSNHVAFNSTFMIISFKARKGATTLSVYDLEAIRNGKNGDDALIKTFNVPFKTCYSTYPHNMIVDDTQIIFPEAGRILDFGFFERFRNAPKRWASFLLWRNVWRAMGVHEHPVDPAHHMEEYRIVIDYFQQLDTNYHTSLKGNLYDGRLEDGKQILRQVALSSRQINKKIYFSCSDNEIQFFNSETDQLITKIEVECCPLLCCCNDSLLVAFCKFGENDHRLEVWRAESPKTLTRVKEMRLGDLNLLKVDEQFIVVTSADNKTYYFISTKTFEVERSLGAKTEYVDYDRGYLFLIKANGPMARIMDVASGTFLHDVFIEKLPHHSFGSCRVNSKYVVIENNGFPKKTLWIYDLESIKATDDVPHYLLLCVIKTKLNGQLRLVDEDQIVCSSDIGVEVFNVASIDTLKCQLLKASLYDSIP